jgi:hypothetical protein
VLGKQNTGPEDAQGDSNPSQGENDHTGNPSHQSTVAAQNTTPKPNANCCNTKNDNKHWLEYAGVIFIGLAFFASAIAAGFNGWQAWIANDNEQRTLRAYVLMNVSSITIDAANNVSAVAQVKNGGLTPAYHVGGWGCLFVGPLEFDGRAVLPSFSGARTDNSTIGSVIGHDDTKTLSHYFCDTNPPTVRSLTADERMRLRAGTAVIYMYGEQTYIDVFGSAHFLKYRIFANDRIDGGVGMTHDDVRGNDAS